MWLDGDAAAAVRIDMTHAEEAVDLYKNSGLPGSSQAVFFVSVASVGLLGFDPLVTAGWFAAGFDAAAPIMVSIAALDHTAARLVYKAGVTPAAPVFWRHRLVLKIDDPAVADSTLRRVFKQFGGVAIARGAGGSLERLWSLPKGQGRALLRTLKAEGVIAVARVPPLDLHLFASRKGDVAIIDAFATFSRTKPDWAGRDRKELVRLLRRKPGTFSARMKSGAAERLSRPGVVAWADAANLHDALEANDLGEHMSAGLALAGGGALPQPNPVCDDFREIAHQGPFRDTAVSATFTKVTDKRGSSLKLRATTAWGLRGAYRLSHAFLLHNDGLLDPLARVETQLSVAAGALYLRSWALLRKLPRPQVLSQSRSYLEQGIYLCGGRSVWTLAAFGWPQIIAMVLDEIAGIHKEASAIVAGARNAGFDLRKMAKRQKDVQAIVVASFDPSVMRLASKYFDLLFGKSSVHSGHRRSYTMWGKGPIRPFAWKHAKIAHIGAGSPAEFVHTWNGSPSSAKPGPSRVVGELHISAQRVANQLPKSSFLQPYRSLLMRMRPVSYRLHFTRDVLEGFLVATIR